MSQYREVIVEKVDSVEGRDSSVIAIFVLAVVAILVVAAVWWQPWNTPATTPTNSTTIIREPGTNTEKTIYVPTPSTAPAGDTNINIKTETPPPVEQKDDTMPTNTETTGDTAGSTGETTSGN